MTPFETAMTGAAPDAVEVRIVRHRVRRTASTAASEWLADELMRTDGTPADAPRPLRVSEIEWVRGDNQVVSVPVADGATFEQDDIAALLAEARRRQIPVSTWQETDHRPSGRMQPGSAWFVGRPAPAPRHDVVTVTATADGVVVMVDESVRPKRWWLVMYPALILSFAWLFFLVLGTLPKMVRDIWRRAMVGVRHRWIASLDADRLTIDVDHDEADRDDADGDERIEIDRAGLVAIGSQFGLHAYTTEGAVPLPTRWVTGHSSDAAAMSDDVAALLNVALGAN